MTWLAFLVVAAHPSCVGSPQNAPEGLPFVSVQPDLLNVPNSFANAWGDYDNDGDLDLAVSLGSGEVRLYRNDAGRLVGIGADLGMPQAGSHELRGLSWGDFDADGDIDLLGGATAADKPTMVLRNDAGKGFVNAAADIGLTIPGRSARQTNWIDYDNDGDLDVYASDRTGDNKLFRNDGGRFTHVFVGVGPTDPRPTVGACWLDIDADGDLDLYLANQSGATDALWRNDGTSFSDVAAALGMTGPPRTKDQGGVGCAIGDYDNDGDFDVFAPNYGHNLLYRNNNDGTFTEVGKMLGVGQDNHAVGADWGDYDNDGDLDLSVISYEGAVGAQTPLNALFRNDGAQGFVNVLTKGSLLNAADHSTQFVDYDNDGGLDLSVTDGYGNQGGHFVFRNTMSAEAKRRSLSVLVLDAEGHHTRFGAEVRLLDGVARVIASRQVVTGGGYNTQRAAPVHFGLANDDPLRVDVTFLTRTGRKTQTLHNVRAADYYGRTLVIREDAGRQPLVESAERQPEIVIQDYGDGLAGVRAANPAVHLSIDRDPSIADDRVLIVEYPAPTNDPAGRDVQCTAKNQDWTTGRAISVQIKPDHAMRLSVSFLDRNRVVFTTWTELKGGVWQQVRIAFDEIRPNPYFQPPDAKRGSPIDVSDVKFVAFAPQDKTPGRLAIGKFVVSK
jgi:hypothetical protein